MLSEHKEMFRNPARPMQDRWIARCDKRCRKAKEICDKDVHLNLQHQLIEHICREREDFMKIDDDEACLFSLRISFLNLRMFFFFFLKKFKYVSFKHFVICICF